LSLSIFFSFGTLIFLLYCYVDRADEGEEEEEPAAHGLAPTSTSNTLVLSEEHRAAAETSPPPQHNLEVPTPMPSSRAPKSKKAKTGAGSTQELATGSTSAPLLEDVSSLFPACHLFCLSNFSPMTIFFFLSTFCIALNEKAIQSGLPFYRVP
jgi:hypothetical protein